MNMVACSHSAADDFAVNRARIVVGLIVMLLGIMWLGERLDWTGFRVNVPLWPWLLVLLGFGRMSEHENAGVNRTALWLMAIGAWGLITEYRLLGFGYGRSWPLLVVIVGVFTIWRALDQAASERTEKGAGR